MTAVGSVGAVRSVVAGLAAAAAVALSGVAYAAPESAALAGAPPKERITVDVLTVNGSGCPGNSASVRTSSDNTGFHIHYSHFEARDGGNSAPTESRRNCQVALQVNIPHGFTLAVASAEYRGRAGLARGSSALHRSNYYLQGQSQNSASEHTFTGPFDGGWRTKDETAVAQLVYAPCGRSVVLNINTELRVNSPSSESKISLKSSEADVDTRFNFGWKEC